MAHYIYVFRGENEISRAMHRSYNIMTNNHRINKGTLFVKL